MSNNGKEPATKSKAFPAAYRKGFQAGLDGKQKQNPYPDWRTSNGRGAIAFSRSLRKLWTQGFDDGTAERVRQEQIFLAKRDPDFDCDSFVPSEVASGASCETDGHYRCRECRWNMERLTEND